MIVRMDVNKFTYKIDEKKYVENDFELLFS